MSKIQVPFWRVIKTFVSEMLMPKIQEIGDIGLSYFYAGNRINFQTSKLYPVVSERAIYSIFKFMGVENIISVFESLLLERKVFFVSQSKTILGYATQAFLGLLYPFKWQQVLIPILPSTLKQLITAPVPLVAGISPSLVDTSIEADSVIVYLDKNEVLNDEDNPPLPQKLLKQLMKRLQKLQIYDPDEVAQFLQNPESTYLFKMQQVQDPTFHGYIIRDIFFQFLLTLMKNYKKFLVKSKDQKDYEDHSIMSLNQPALMSNIFKIQDFLTDLGMTKVGSFGYKFTESSIFTSFIERRFQYPNDDALLFFDDCIQRKKNKKQMAFIMPIVNKQYVTMKNPEIDPEDSGPFFYNQFPSLLKDPIIKEEEIQLTISDRKEEEQSRLLTLIQQEYQLNCQFFQHCQSDDQLGRKMLNLLLNKNKSKFDLQDIHNKVSIMHQFLSLYSKQILEIDVIFNEWPSVLCQQKFKSINKHEYLHNDKKVDDGFIVGVEENMDYQVLLRKQTKLVFMSSQMRTSIASYKNSSMVIQVLSFRIKNFINGILKNQAGFFLDFCQKQAAKDVRASSLRKTSEQTWNIETIILFKNWLNYEKQFGTGATLD